MNELSTKPQPQDLTFGQAGKGGVMITMRTKAGYFAAEEIETLEGRRFMQTGWLTGKIPTGEVFDLDKIRRRVEDRLRKDPLLAMHVARMVGVSISPEA